MIFWDAIVDFLRLFIVTQTQLCGGSIGGGILMASFFFRAALFPWTLKMAKASQLHQQAMLNLKPELDEINKKYANSPESQFSETQELFKRHSVSQFPLASCLGTLCQSPIYIAFYSAVRQVANLGGRFLWIGNVAKPDFWLTGIVTALTFGSVLFTASAVASPPETRRMMLVVPVVVTMLVLVQTSAGVALYFGVSSAVSMLQSYAVRRSLSAA